MQRTAPPVKSSLNFAAIPYSCSWCRDGNTTTATYHNAAAVDYESSLMPATYTAIMFEQDHRVKRYQWMALPSTHGNGWLSLGPCISVNLCVYDLLVLCQSTGSWITTSYCNHVWVKSQRTKQLWRKIWGRKSTKTEKETGQWTVSNR